jgi:hypothetical protein
MNLKGINKKSGVFIPGFNFAQNSGTRPVAFTYILRAFTQSPQFVYTLQNSSWYLAFSNYELV